MVDLVAKLDPIEFSRRKLTSVIEQIEILKAADFPHEGGMEALDHLKRVFESDLHRFEKLPPQSDIQTKKAACEQINFNIWQFLPILGFILRSTNVRNSFEFFDPILRLSKTLLGDDAKLILSSEWEYSPMTYPLVFDELPNFVFIGLPTSEVQNALIIPLSGHELGHSLWSAENIENKISNNIQEALLDICMTNSAKFKTLFDIELNTKEQLKTDMFLRDIWSESLDYALTQCEEIFCDIVGIRIFGESFLYSFQYLIAPFLGVERSFEYPEMTVRAELMIEAAEKFGCSSPADFKEHFSEQKTSVSREQMFILEMADQAARRMFDSLLHEVDQIANTRSIKLPVEEKISHICKRFELGIPSEYPGSLSNIILAGWKTYLNPKIWEDFQMSDEEKFRVLNELIFKTIEVFEIEQRQKSTHTGA